jgi:hypothetical protein
MSMNTTLVINAKGGVGKTTITTNLASYFASRGIQTTIADFDPQGSSLNWLAQRAPMRAKIHGADLAPRNGTGLQIARRLIPRETQQLIIDAPAGPSRLLLQDLLARHAVDLDSRGAVRDRCSRDGELHQRPPAGRQGPLSQHPLGGAREPRAYRETRLRASREVRGLARHNRS